MTAHDIWHGGYEGWREPLEMIFRKEVPHAAHGSILCYASLSPTKGVGRAAVLWFGILYSFLVLKDSMSEEQLGDLKRQVRATGILGIMYHPLRDPKRASQRVVVTTGASPWAKGKWTPGSAAAGSSRPPNQLLLVASYLVDFFNVTSVSKPAGIAANH